MKKNIKWVMTITLLIVLVVLVYYKAINKDAPIVEEGTTVTDKDRLLSKDLEEDYPITVCQVVQVFTRIQKCYYNEEYTNEELVKLAYMAATLFDEELIESNPFDEYFADLEEEIEQFDKEGRIISRVIVGKSSDVKYSTIEGVKYASVECIYYTKTDDGTTKNTTTYILRKDEEDRWKILGWQEFVPDEWEE